MFSLLRLEEVVRQQATMRPSQEPPSMMELCHIFKKRKGSMWGQTPSSKFDDSLCYERIWTRTITRIYFLAKRASATEVACGQPLRLTQTWCCTQAYYENAS